MTTLKGKLRCVALTDTGKVREHNEDTIAIDADIGLLVLADGMGGYNAGEVASGIAVKTIINLVREGLSSARTSSATGSETRACRARRIVLRDAITRANKIIYQTAQIAGRSAKAWARRWSLPSSTTTRFRSRTSAIRASTACAATQFAAGHDGSLAAAGARRSRLLFASRKRSGRPTRTT